MVREKITDYIFHTTFDSSITDITDKFLVQTLIGKIIHGQIIMVKLLIQIT